MYAALPSGPSELGMRVTLGLSGGPLGGPSGGPPAPPPPLPLTPPCSSAVTVINGDGNLERLAGSGVGRTADLDDAVAGVDLKLFPGRYVIGHRDAEDGGVTADAVSTGATGILGLGAAAAAAAAAARYRRSGGAQRREEADSTAASAAAAVAAARLALLPPASRSLSFLHAED